MKAKKTMNSAVKEFEVIFRRLEGEEIISPHDEYQRVMEATDEIQKLVEAMEESLEPLPRSYTTT
jgi:hypothetical protein